MENEDVNLEYCKIDYADYGIRTGAGNCETRYTIFENNNYGYYDGGSLIEYSLFNNNII